MTKTTFNKTAIAGLLAASLFATGCSTTGSSSSNTTLGYAPEPVSPAIEAVENVAAEKNAAGKAAAKDVDAVRPVDVINRSKAHVTRSGEIYLMRGLANIFSRGIDTMTEKMRARGMDASNFSYKYWRPIADDIAARAKRREVSYPLVIIGHSLGGNESSKFANYLAQRGVKVDLVIAYDPVETGHVGANIDTVINYYLPKREDNRIHAVNGFTGKLENIDLSGKSGITHTNVEKNPKFQSASIKRVMAITKAL